MCCDSANLSQFVELKNWKHRKYHLTASAEQNQNTNKQTTKQARKPKSIERKRHMKFNCFWCEWREICRNGFWNENARWTCVRFESNRMTQSIHTWYTQCVSRRAIVFIKSYIFSSSKDAQMRVQSICARTLVRLNADMHMDRANSRC